MTFDAIVVGAGVNGLVAAAYLAKGGLRTLVVERRPVVGGTLVTEEIAPGFRVDACLHDAGWLSPRIVDDLELKKHGLELLLSDGGVFAPLPTRDHLLLPADPARAADTIRRHSAEDARRWPEFAGRVARLAGFLEALYTAPPPRVDAKSISDFATLFGLGRRLRGLGKTEMVELLRTIPMSVAELLDDWFECDALKGVVGARGVTRITQGPRSGGTAFVLLHHQVGRPAGAIHAPVVPRGGVGELARALAAAARAAGAEVRTGAAVARVAMRGASASGVVLETGEEIAAARVVSSADPRRTFLDLCDPSRLDPELVRAAGTIRFRGSWAKVNLALDALPVFTSRPSGDGDAHLRGTICIAPSLDYVERAYDDAKYGRISAHPYLAMRIPSLADPSLAPAGKHVMSIDVQYAPYRLRDGAWDDAARDALGDRVMETLAEYAPGIRDLVRHRQVLTPRDLEETFALTEGNAYHGELTLDQILFMRPVPACSRYRTPVRGLYLCGSGTHPGGAIAGGAGMLAAREVLRDVKRE